jgi:hypothetical protein
MKKEKVMKKGIKITIVTFVFTLFALKVNAFDPEVTLQVSKGIAKWKLLNENKNEVETHVYVSSALRGIIKQDNREEVGEVNNNVMTFNGYQNRYKNQITLDRIRTKQMDIRFKNQIMLDRIRTKQMDIRFKNQMMLDRIRTKQMDIRFKNQMMLDRIRTRQSDIIHRNLIQKYQLPERSNRLSKMKRDLLFGYGETVAGSSGSIIGSIAFPAASNIVGVGGGIANQTIGTIKIGNSKIRNIQNYWKLSNPRSYQLPKRYTITARPNLGYSMKKH